MHLDIADDELMECICQRVADMVSKPLCDLAFIRWLEGVGPGPRIRDLQLTALQTGVQDSILVSPLRSFLVSRIRRATRANWLSYARERLGGVLDPSRHTTRELEDFFERFLGEG